MTSPVMAALHSQRYQEASAFGKWCIINKRRPLPASPSDVAAFIRDCEPIASLAEIWKFITEISVSHLENNLADPTVGGQPARAMNAISELEAPRSWPRLMKERFKEIPYDVQAYLVESTGRREAELRRAQNQAADAQKKLLTLQQTVQGRTDVDTTKSQIAAA
jgi:hypothetical protein